MTTKNANAELVRQLFAAYEANDAAQMDALLAPDFIAHGLPRSWARAHRP
jgi:ketosteroid isomerase-like protein